MKSKCAQLLASSLLLCTVPSSAALSSIPPIKLDLPPECAAQSVFIKRLFTNYGLLSYDAVLELIEQIENGDLDDVCTPKILS